MGGGWKRFARWIKYHLYYRRRLKKRWVMIDMLTHTIKWVDVGSVDVIYYYLYENGLGQRDVEIRSTGYADRRGRDNRLYFSKIVPWLAGKNFDDIKKYSEVMNTDNHMYVYELYRRLRK